MRQFAAHEFLETQECLRTKTAHIELYSVLLDMAQDEHLRDILKNQQNRMMHDYQQGLGMLTGRGISFRPVMHTPQINQYEQTTIGLNQPRMMAPNPNARTLSDECIATIALNLHKTGSAIAMLWACECVDPQIRLFHTTCANVCQEMAYEIWQFMNYKGYYQTPEFPNQTMQTMQQSFQTQPMFRG